MDMAGWAGFEDGDMGVGAQAEKEGVNWEVEGVGD